MRHERVVVVGGGLVGLATAWALQDEGHEIVLAEKEAGWAEHQSSHNSGVIHSGLYYAPGGLKARLATRASRELPQLCDGLGVDYRITGKLVLATRAEELPRMRELHKRGLANGVPVREITMDEIHEREPAVAGVGGLWVESTGVCDFAGLARALAERLGAAGADLRLGTKVTRLTEDARGVTVELRAHGQVETLRADRVVNCSGLFSDRLLPKERQKQIRIVPFRGEYWTLRRPDLVNGLVYPVPDPELPFLGVHLTRGWDGSVHVGPNAVLAFKQEGYGWRDVNVADLWRAARFPGLWRMARSQLSTGISEMARSLVPSLFLKQVQLMLPSVVSADLERAPAGVRAQAVTRGGAPSDDFVIHRTERVVHVVNAPSPAATASVQIGQHIAHLLGQ